MPPYIRLFPVPHMHLRPYVLMAAALSAPLAPARGQTATCDGGTAAGYPCFNVDLMARVPLSTFGAGASRISEAWGWTDPADDREYAIVGVVDGTVFVDVTQPTAPVYLGKLPSALPHPVNGRWRVFRTYGNHVFVGSEINDHGIQVFDLTRLRSVTSPPVTFTVDAHYTGNGNTHTIWINEATGYMYLAGATEAGYACNAGGLHIVDVSSPLSPVLAGCFQDPGGPVYVHETECVVYAGPDADYTGREICVNYVASMVTFVDVTDKANPTVISRASYPLPGYTHQGTFTSDWRHLLVDDELDETNGSFATARTIILDVQDLDDVEYVGAYMSPVAATDHNQYVVGRYVYQANDMAGLRILDTQDVASGTLTEVAYFDTYPAANLPGFEGMWMAYPFFPSGNIVAGDREGGLFVLRPDQNVVASEPEATVAGHRLSSPTPNPATDRATARLTVDRAQHVRAELFDALGRRVAVAYDGPVAAGVSIPISMEVGSLPPGIYVVRVHGETFAASRSLSIVR